ncbi:MAG: rRNA adenine dimethyltransferase family protein, partial [Candidatus Omnitrophica bacterium]|nr:rRNA adenine dimethyltransferase family protein [Candidatus Omnitrophota bacterium]
LPYCITSPILAYLIENRRFISSIYVTVQKELAERITASPGGKEYGALTIYLNYYTRPSSLFAVKNTGFYPQPAVDSCFLRLEILNKPPVEVKDEALFFNIVRSSFQKRRKTILNSLKQSKLELSKEELAAILEKAGIDHKRRPETLSTSDFARLIESWKS